MNISVAMFKTKNKGILTRFQNGCWSGHKLERRGGGGGGDGVGSGKNIQNAANCPKNTALKNKN